MPTMRLGGVYGMVSGGILVSIEGPDRCMHPAHIVRRGTWFGFGPLMTQRNRLFLAQALEPSTVAQVPLAAMERMIATDPTCAKHLGSMTTYGQDAIISCVADLLIRDATARIAAVLLRVTGVLDGIEPDDPSWVRSHADTHWRPGERLPPDRRPGAGRVQGAGLDRGELRPHAHRGAPGDGSVRAGICATRRLGGADGEVRRPPARLRARFAFEPTLSVSSMPGERRSPSPVGSNAPPTGPGWPRSRGSDLERHGPAVSGQRPCMAGVQNAHLPAIRP
jgi:CRP-like cAMP-binding protein